MRRILLATGNEMALVISLAGERAAAQASAEAAVDEFLTRLLQPQLAGPDAQPRQAVAEYRAEAARERLVRACRNHDRKRRPSSALHDDARCVS